MKNIMENIVTIAVAIIGLAMLAVIVGNRSKTSQVIDSASRGFVDSLAVAISPVTGGGLGGSSRLF